MTGAGRFARGCDALARLAAPSLALARGARRDGEEARVVGGAVRNALLGRAGRPIATSPPPPSRPRSRRAARRAGWKVVADRHRAWHRDRHHRRPSVRGDDAAPGHRRPTAATPWCASAATSAPTRCAATSPSTPSRSRRGRRAPRLCRRPRRPCGAPDPLHRRRRQAHRARTICASCASSASMPAMARARSIAPSFAAAIRRPGRPRAPVARARPCRDAEAPGRRAAPRRCSRQIDGAGFLLAMLGGVARAATFARLAEAEAALGLAPDPVRRLARSRPLRRRGWRPPGGAAAPIQCREPAASSHDRHRRRGDAPDEPDDAGAKALAYRLGRRGAARRPARRGRAGRARRPGGDALAVAESWTSPRLPFGGADAARLGLSPGPDIGRLLAEAERLWIAAGFPADAAGGSHPAPQAAAAIRPDATRCLSGEDRLILPRLRHAGRRPRRRRATSSRTSRRSGIHRPRQRDAAGLDRA